MRSRHELHGLVVFCPAGAWQSGHGYGFPASPKWSFVADWVSSWLNGAVRWQMNHAGGGGRAG